MSEKDTRRLLKRACDDLDRFAKSARKAILPTALGATLALGGCASAPKSEATPDPVHKDPVQVVADAGTEFAKEPPPPEDKPQVDAAVPVSPKGPKGPPRWAPDRPYMAPDAVALYQTIDEDDIA